MGRRRPFIALIASTWISTVGSAITLIALPWFVLDTTGSGARTGLVATMETLGLVASLALAGPLVDRYGAKRIAIIADLTAASAVAGVPIFHGTVGLPYPILLVLAFVIGIGRAPARSARAVLLPDVLEYSGVSRERGTSAQEAAHGAGDLLGAPLGGVLIAVFGPVTVLLVDVLTLASAASLIAVFIHCGRTAEHSGADTAAGVRGYLAESRLGIAALWRDPLLRAMAMFNAGINALLVAMSSVLLPAFGNTVWHDSTQTGLVIAAFGAGGLLGTLVYGWLGARWRRWPTFCVSLIVCGPPVFLVVALDPQPALLITLVLLCAIGNGPVNPLIAGVKYDRIPIELRGRVFAAMAALALAAMPVGTMVAGFLLDAAGPFGASTILGCVALVLVLCPLVFPVWRALDDPPLVPSAS